MKIVYAHGSCRINCPLSILDNLEIVNLINNRWNDWLGNFYYLPQQYRLIDCLLHHTTELLDIDENLLWQINTKNARDFRSDWNDVFHRLSKKIHSIDCMVIEVSSLKDDKRKMPVEEAIGWIHKVEGLVVKPCVWVCHIRPQLFGDKAIPARDEVFTTLVKSNVTFFDPSPHLKKTMLQDPQHYNEYGYSVIANELRKVLNDA